jgi:hypothetical protein
MVATVSLEPMFILTRRVYGTIIVTMQLSRRLGGKNIKMPTNGRTPSKSERFANRRVTTGQIALINGRTHLCPAAFAVLLVCLQLKRVAPVALVMAFSLGWRSC